MRVIAVSLLLSSLPQSSLRLPTLFTDHMVVQRGKPINVWGWDAPGQKVTISLGGKSATATTDVNGKFMASLPKLNAGGPFILEVSGSAKKSVQDVLVGEVWVCSGQSNMEWPMSLANDRAQAKTETDPNVRMFTVPKLIAQEPQTDVVGSWVQAKPETIDSFSAVGYAFARKLQRDLKVPVGMIHTSWGGTVAEAWTNSKYFSSSDLLKPILDRMKGSEGSMAQAEANYRSKVAVYQTKALPIFFDTSDSAWTQAGFDDSSWTPTAMPFVFPDDFDGEYRHRRTVNLTAEQAQSIKTIELGPIDDFDQTYINGQLVGQIDMMTPQFWSTPRKYSIPAGTLKEGENIIAVRTYDSSGAGGFFGTKDSFRLGDINIAGIWETLKGKNHVVVDPKVTGPQPPAPEGKNNPNFPSTLYNGMLAPLAPYSVKGAIWYQGESNAGRAVQYTALLSAMIQNWRDDFGQPKMSFYIAQLANFMAPNQAQFDSAWAELRDAQDIVGQMAGNGTATIVDIGEANDIHPRNKRDVGERLARIALKKDYGMRIEWQGPRFKSMSSKGDEITITFDHATGLRTADGQEPRCFAIAGSDSKWKWATGRIEGNKVILKRSGDEAMVRYAWQDNPPVNLINADGLPAMPFRTDSFPLTTRNNR